MKTYDGYRYIVTVNSDYHVLTAGGVKLYVNPDHDGYYPIEAWGVLGDGTTGDRARAQQAMDSTPYLLWQAKTYLFGEYVATPSAYNSSHHYACIYADGKSIAWRTRGGTVLKINDTILFQRDAAEFSAPGFTFNENASAQGYGAPFACYGVTVVSLAGVTAVNCNSLRLGSSAIAMCGEVSGTVKIANSCGMFMVSSPCLEVDGVGASEVWPGCSHCDLVVAR